MTETRDRLIEEAVGWAIRLRHAEAEDWEAFTQWLEADPDHLAAYEEVVALDADLDGLPHLPQRRADAWRQSRSVPRRAVLGWGVAAALVAMVGYNALQGGDARYAVETGPGERRSIVLAGGNRIDLNGASRIVLYRDDPRFSELERGEALFTVVHDASKPFLVEVGDAVIRDLGTVFNVVRGPASIAVAVAEGEVGFAAGGRVVNLDRGETLRQANGTIVTGRRDPAEIGGWRSGRLSYSSATIAEVAADLSRNTGLVVSASPAVAGRRFSGVIVLDPDRAQLFRRVSALLAVEARPTAEGWILTAGGR